MERLTSEKALEIAIEQKEIQELLESRSIVDFKYTFYKEYEGVINIITKQTMSKNIIEN